MDDRDRDLNDLEQELRSARPRARARFLQGLAASGEPRRRAFRGHKPVTVALVGVASLAVAGGIGFAASSAVKSSSVKVVRVAGAGALKISVRNAATEEYPTSEKVTSEKPPVMSVKNFTNQKPTDDKPLEAIQPKGSKSILLKARLKVNVSGKLAISVTGSDGKKIQLAGGSTTVDGDIVGGGNRTDLVYDVIIPRELNVWVTISVSKVEPGEDLSINLVYTDDQQREAKIEVPAKAPATIDTAPVPKCGDAGTTPKTYTLGLNIGNDKVKVLKNSLLKDGSAAVTIKAGAIGSKYLTIDYNGRKAQGSKDSYALRVELRSAKTAAAADAVLASLDKSAAITATGCVVPAIDIVGAAVFE